MSGPDDRLSSGANSYRANVALPWFYAEASFGTLVGGTLAFTYFFIIAGFGWTPVDLLESRTSQTFV